MHRILGGLLTGERHVPADLEAIGEESSRRERVAMEASARSSQLKKIQFHAGQGRRALRRPGDRRHAVGFFGELKDWFVEGLVHVSALGEDYYEHVERQHMLRGKRTKRTFRVGDPVRVVVAGVSIERRQIDFGLEGIEERKGGPWRKPRRSS